MATPKTIRQYGDQLVLWMDDGTKFIGVPTNTPHMFVISATPGSGGGVTPPTPGDGTMMQPFTPDRYDASDPFGNIRPSGNAHTGSDYNGMPAGTEVPAVSAGEVVFSGWEPTGGNGYCLCVKMFGVSPTPEFPAGTDIYWAYLHGNQTPLKAVGDTVSKGEIVFILGNTGTNSQGAHLHITLSNSPRAYQGVGTKVDPHAFISARV